MTETGHDRFTFREKVAVVLLTAVMLLSFPFVWLWKSLVRHER